MPGILAIWNDIEPEGYEHFELWYNREHLQERVGVPGFRFGRRYEAVSDGDRRFFAFYEVDSPAVLTSPAYLRRLETPTPWTQKTMTYFRGMVRTVCDLRQSAGDLVGSYAVVLRADEAFAPTPAASALVEELAALPSIARVQIWTAAASQTKADTAEMKIRGKDRLTAGAFVVECVRLADAERVASVLSKSKAADLGMTEPSVLGIYGLLCIKTSG
ncbi:MAG: hypothetical protein HC869_17135 [Rhodospirillales bacterium]|nr:hypothetical protein [Rhodospirillales bacterium]